MFVGSGDPGGVAGCQVWVAKRLRLQPTEVTHVNPRLSIVASNSDSKRCAMQIVSTHAPTDNAPRDVKDAYWRSLSHHTARLRVASPKCVIHLVH